MLQGEIIRFISLLCLFQCLHVQQIITCFTLICFNNCLSLNLQNMVNNIKTIVFWTIVCIFCYIVKKKKNQLERQRNFYKINRLTSKRLLFWCYSPCPEDSEKDCCSNKTKPCCYLLHIQALKKAIDWWSWLFLLYNSSQCLAICNVLALATTSCSVQYGYEIFMLVRKCYCEN